MNRFDPVRRQKPKRFLIFFISPFRTQHQAIMVDSSSSSESELETPIAAPTTANDAPPTTAEAPPTASGDQEGNQQKKAPRRTHSVAHEDFVANNVVLFNVDLETGGNDCGPVQISVAAYDPRNKISLDEFDSHVKPANGAEWSQHTINVHGIEPSQQRIKDASQIEDVWHDLLEYFAVVIAVVVVVLVVLVLVVLVVLVLLVGEASAAGGKPIRSRWTVIVARSITVGLVGWLVGCCRR
jgi:hypothetical protein